MGAGEHGGFGNTAGSSKSGIFTRTWFEGTVVVDSEVRDVSRRCTSEMTSISNCATPQAEPIYNA